MARARFRDVALREDSVSGLLRIIPNPQITLFEPGTTTPVGQTIYADATTGAVLPNPFVGDADGSFEFYLAAAADVDIDVNGASAGVGQYTLERQPVLPQAADLLYQSMFGGFFRIGQNAGNTAMILNPGGAQPIPVASFFQVIGDAPVAGGTFVMHDAVMTSAPTGAAQDAGATRAVGRHMGGTQGSLVRASEHQVLRQAGSLNTFGLWVQEVGIHDQVGGNGSTLTGGLYVFSDDSFFGSGCVRADFGVLTTGTRGFFFPFLALDTDGTTRLFSVGHTGIVQAKGNVLPTVTDVASLGNGALNWLGVYGTFHLVTTATGAAQPAITASYDTNTGLFFPGGDIIGVGVGGAEVGRWIASGLQLEGSAILKQIATPSAPAAGYTSVYGKAGGGVFSRANGGAEKQHKAGGQIGSSVGSTANPTTTSGSYSTIQGDGTSSELRVDLTTTGGDLIATLTGSFAVGTGSTSYVLALSLDGAAEVATRSLTQGTASFLNTVTVSHRFTGVSAAAHIVRARWLVAGGATLTAFSIERSLIVQETAT